MATDSLEAIKFANLSILNCDVVRLVRRCKLSNGDERVFELL